MALALQRRTALEKLAANMGVECGFTDGLGHAHTVDDETLVALINALGLPCTLSSDLDALHDEQTRTRCAQVVEPVTVIWDTAPVAIVVTLPQSAAHHTIGWTLHSSDALGPCEGRVTTAKASAVTHQTLTSGQQWASFTLILGTSLPFGYHRLTLDIKGCQHETLLVCSPSTAYRPPSCGQPEWGLFAPIYALHHRSSWGAGDLGDLRLLSDWLHKMGGTTIATLPLLPQDFSDRFDPSPYNALSRLFWNEFFVDLCSVPEIVDHPSTRSRLQAAGRALSVHDVSKPIDYLAIMRAKRGIMEHALGRIADWPIQRRESFNRAVDDHPNWQSFATFRAYSEVNPTPWPEWAAGPRQGDLSPTDVQAKRRLFHLYAQWLAEEQMATLHQHLTDQNQRLFLDLPVGVSDLGYDAWRFPHLFCNTLSVGAPADFSFRGGQNWGFAPLHPQAQRKQGYSYLRAVLHHHMRYAGTLRIDHVMGLHRLYCIPRDAEAACGSYVHYPWHELYALFCLESHRCKTALVGENLGTVPDYVDQALDDHGFFKIHLGQYRLGPDPTGLPEAPTANTFATMNTHDTPTFAAFVANDDLESFRCAKLASDQEIQQIANRRLAAHQALIEQRHENEDGRHAQKVDAHSHHLLSLWLEFLARGESSCLTINIEDLWGEMRAQNIPGTGHRRDNWQQLARLSLETLFERKDIGKMLTEVDRLCRTPR